MKAALLVLLLALTASAQTELPLWPGREPQHEPRTVVQDKLVAGKPWTFIGPVQNPTLTVYPARGKNTGVAVLVFPGGGYQILAIDLEGSEVCDWLASRGITAILLKYRVPGLNRFPKSGAYPNSPLALRDAQRAMGLVRLHAREWGIDPRKVGVLGFSAGGHLVGALSTNYTRRLYKPVDAADKLSCRPDFGVALYPGHMLEHTSRPHQLNPYVPVTAKTPPQLIVQAEDDPVDPVENSLVYFEALQKARVPVEMHLYATGGHAFGMRPTRHPITHWPELMEKWLVTIRMLP